MAVVTLATHPSIFTHCSQLTLAMCRSGANLNHPRQWRRRLQCCFEVVEVVE